MGEYKAFWFSFYDYDSYRAKYKKRTAANFRTYFTGVVKKGKSLGMNRDHASKTIWRCHL